jgi:CheY-like chemotaxis protein
LKKKFYMANTVIGVFVDDRMEQIIYERAFQRMEHRVEGHVFTSPEAGIEALKSIRFDVVFIEVHFWGENFGGISILHELQRVMNNRVIAIAVTPLLQEGDIEKIIRAGFALCIEKPMTIESLQIFCGQEAVN